MILITARGRLAYQPEIKVGKQTSFCEFRLLSSRFARGEEHTEAVTFFCYGEEAERFCESTEKGQVIEATGTQETHHWTEPGGQDRSTVKYKLTWWQSGPRSARSRQAAAAPQGGVPAGARDRSVPQPSRPSAPATDAVRSGPNDDEGRHESGLI